MTTPLARLDTQGKLLARRTAYIQAQASMQRFSEEHIRKYEHIIVKVMIFVSLVDRFWYELEDELVAEGKFCHANKFWYNKATATVANVHQQAWMLLDSQKRRQNGTEFNASRWYNHSMDEAYKDVTEAILLPPPLRAYNILKALCRLTIEHNKRLDQFETILYGKMAEVLKILNRMNIEDKHMDYIILTAINWHNIY